MSSQDSIPFGYCHCGCGQRTQIAQQSKTKHGYVKGQPRLFLRGHSSHQPEETKPPYAVDEATGCWVWQRQLTESGYGRIERDGVKWAAHRWYYTQANGPIPEGMDIDHLCRNRACVNPDHIEPVSEAENVRRGISAKLTAEDVREIRRLYGQLSMRALAQRYGVDVGNIHSIIHRLTWRDVE